MEHPVRNQLGDTIETIELNDDVFSVPMNNTLIHHAVVIYQGNKRQGTHDTKTRAQVSGGGRKPWIQKHTGRARQGSTRSPQWRHEEWFSGLIHVTTGRPYHGKCVDRL